MSHHKQRSHVEEGLTPNFVQLQNAFKSYIRMRDYCATSKQIIAMCLAVIKTGFELGNHVHVNNYIQKAEQTPGVEVCSSSSSICYPKLFSPVGTLPPPTDGALQIANRAEHRLRGQGA